MQNVFSLTTEQTHAVLVLGQYVFAPVLLWGVKRIGRGIVNEAMEKVEERANGVALKRANEVRVDLGDKIVALDRRIDTHTKEDRESFREISNKLDRLMQRHRPA